jgi:hypothetical protein
MDENELVGSIPSCMGRLSKLEQLYVFSNDLTGEVPSDLGMLQRLSKYEVRWKSGMVDSLFVLVWPRPCFMNSSLQNLSS